MLRNCRGNNSETLQRGVNTPNTDKFRKPGLSYPDLNCLGLCLQALVLGTLTFVSTGLGLDPHGYCNLILVPASFFSPSMEAKMYK